MSRKYIVGNFMTPSVHSIGMEQPIAVAAEKMAQYKVRHLPVLKEGVVVGLISDRDLSLALIGDPGKKFTVQDIMSDPVYMVPEHTLLCDVATTLFQRKIDSAVVVDNKQRPVGIFTSIDGMRLLSIVLNGDIISLESI